MQQIWCHTGYNHQEHYFIAQSGIDRLGSCFKNIFFSSLEIVCPYESLVNQLDQALNYVALASLGASVTTRIAALSLLSAGPVCSREGTFPGEPWQGLPPSPQPPGTRAASVGLQALSGDMGSQVRPPARLAWMCVGSRTYWCSSPNLPNCLCLLGSSFSHGDFFADNGPGHAASGWVHPRVEVWDVGCSCWSMLMPS